MAERPTQATSEVLWIVRLACQDLCRAGIRPTADRLGTDLGNDYDEHMVRVAFHELISAGELPNKLEEVEVADKKRFAIALYRVVNDKGGVYDALSTITGKTPNALKCLVNAAHERYTTEELDPGYGRLDNHEKQYLNKLAARSDDPAVKEFAEAQLAPQRVRPSCRGAKKDIRQN